MSMPLTEVEVKYAEAQADEAARDGHPDAPFLLADAKRKRELLERRRGMNEMLRSAPSGKQTFAGRTQAG